MACGKTVYLKAKVPKILVARKQINKIIELEAIPYQPEERPGTNVTVTVHKWSARNEKVQLAFIFSHSSSNSQTSGFLQTTPKHYILKVDGDKLKLELLTAGKKTNEPKAKYLFKWLDPGNGSWHQLQSVSPPSTQLFIDLKGSKVSLSSNSTDYFQLTSNGTTDIKDTDIEYCSCWRDYLKEV